MKSFNLTAAALLLAGSLSTGAVQATDADSGWRLGRVVEIGDAAAVAIDRRARCADSLDAAAGNYARVSYSGDPRFQRRAIAAVPADTPVKVGDRVYVNVSRCDAAIRTSSTNADQNPR